MALHRTPGTAFGLLVAGVFLAVPPPGDVPAAAQASATIGAPVLANGSGCPLGTAVVALSPDNSALTVIYSKYLVEYPAASTKNCALIVPVTIPTGYTAAIVGVDYYGFTMTAPSTAIILYTQYHWQGQDQVQYTFAIPGGTGSWERHDVVDPLWRPCGAQLHLVINSRLYISSATVGDLVSMESTDANVSTVFRLDWAQCPLS